MSDQPPTPPDRIEILGGGEVDDATLAALVVALTPVPVAPPPPERPVARVPAWARAALLEGVGGRRPARPGDLRVRHVGG